MEAENFIALHHFDGPACENGGDDSFDKMRTEVDSQGTSSKDKEEKLNNEDVHCKSDIEDKNCHWLQEANPEKDLINGYSGMEIKDLSKAPILTDAGCGLDNTGIQNFSNEPGQADSQSSTLADKKADLQANPEKDLINGDSDMEIKDLSEAPALTAAGCGVDNTGIHNFSDEPGQADSQYNTLADKDGPCMPKAIHDKDLVDNSSFSQVNVNLTETVEVAEASNNTVGDEIGHVAFQEEISIGSQKRVGGSISGVKRARVMFEEQQPSVCVKYNFLTRSSKHKLQELLQHWSEWHAQHKSSSQDPPEEQESGEETYFPALHIGMEKASSVPFWIEKQTRKQEKNEFIPLDTNSVPLYDRAFSLGLTSDGGSSNVEGGLEIVDEAIRCFNCGSYNHALKECPKPRDNVAVNNARKQHKLKRNQNPGSRNPTRYYQNSPAGKYDGLRPGALDAETRKLLGLREFDPPPWLSRMREIGYPPGYLDPDEDQPSGIAIYADGEVQADQEDGEIIETDNHEPKRKMTVEFPGINGPIPENADQRLWTAAPASTSDINRNRSHRRSNNSSEPISRSHHREERRSREFRDDGPPGVDEGFRRSREFRDDGPPGVDEGFSPAMSTFLPRYGSSYESTNNSHSPRRNPSFGMLESDRGRSRRFLDKDYGHGSFNSSQHSSHHSPKEYGYVGYGNRVDESRNDYDFDYSSYNRERQDRYRHLSRR